VISADGYSKSNFSVTGECIEVCFLSDDTIGLRDPKDTTRPPHLFSKAQWRAFVAGVRNGEFDV
jgi:Domain of unknown function (DUF397)